MLAGIILLVCILFASWLVGSLASIVGADNDDLIDTIWTGYTYLALFAVTLSLASLIGEVARNIWREE
jgi:hypothetical protein